METQSQQELLRQAAEAIWKADALLIAAGAGMGVDSGLPDFRGNEGFWKAYPVIGMLGHSFAQMANPKWFYTKPNLAWAFYGHRLNLYRKTVPHGGFAQLLQWAKEKPLGYFVFTSNVDGHFQRAGFAPDQIVECHGSIHHFQCLAPCRNEIWEADDETVHVDERVFRASDPLPECRYCQGMSRPNVLMFGDSSWLPKRSGAQENRLSYWIERVKQSGRKAAVIELGAGTAIPTVRVASETMFDSELATLIRINPREPEVPPGQIALPMGAAASIAAIGKEIEILKGS